MPASSLEVTVASRLAKGQSSNGCRVSHAGVSTASRRRDAERAAVRFSFRHRRRLCAQLCWDQWCVPCRTAAAALKTLPDALRGPLGHSGRSRGATPASAMGRRPVTRESVGSNGSSTVARTHRADANQVVYPIAVNAPLYAREIARATEERTQFPVILQAFVRYGTWQKQKRLFINFRWPSPYQ